MPHEKPGRRFPSVCVALIVTTLAIPAFAQTATVVVKPAPSAAECAAHAERAAMNSTGPAGGAMRGSVGGAAFGAIVGGSTGARRGAVAGAVVGGVAGSVHRDDVYRRVYDDCMRGY